MKPHPQNNSIIFKRQAVEFRVNINWSFTLFSCPQVQTPGVGIPNSVNGSFPTITRMITANFNMERKEARCLQERNTLTTPVQGLHLG